MSVNIKKYKKGGIISVLTVVVTLVGVVIFPSTSAQSTPEIQVLASNTENTVSTVRAPETSVTQVSPPAPNVQPSPTNAVATPVLAALATPAEEQATTNHQVGEEPVPIGVLSLNVKTYVGGSVCGFPNGFCEMPFQAQIIIKDEKGSVVKSGMSDANGALAFKLSPGTYKVEPQDGGGIHPAPSPKYITVEDGQVTYLTVVYDPIAITN